MYQIYSKHINTNIAFPTWSPYIWFMQQAVLLIVTLKPQYAFPASRLQYLLLTTFGSSVCNKIINVMTYLSVVFILCIHSFNAVVCYIDLTNTYSSISPLKKTSFCSSIFILLIYADRENLFNYMVLHIRDKIIMVSQPEINRFALHIHVPPLCI